jgi:hypothetical protein
MVAESPVSTPPSGRRRVLLTVLCLASFLGVADLQRRLVPWPDTTGLREKVDHFEAHKDTYDVVFCGSSLVLRSFRPLVIDELLAGAGRPLTSFNLGVQGLRGFELDHLVRRVLDMRPERLRYVVLEVPDYNRSLREKQTGTWRYQFWHTALQTLHALMAVPLTADEGLTLVDRAKMAFTHMVLLASRATAYGSGPRVAGPLLGRESFPIFGDEVLDGLRGYQSLERAAAAAGKTSVVAKRRLKFLDEIDAFQALVSNIREEKIRTFASDSYSVHALRSLVQAIEGAGAEAIFVVPPMSYGLRELNALEQERQLEYVLRLDHPDEHPAFYRVAAHFDSSHLNEQAAWQASGMFARAFLEWFPSSGESGDG